MLTKPHMGADPEFFIVKKNELKAPTHIMTKYVYPHTIAGLEENKEPLEVESMGTISRDGLSLELQPYPTECRDELVMNIASLMQDSITYIREQVGEDVGLLASPKLSIYARTYAEENIIRSFPKDVLETGCDPDRNAYTNEEKSPKKLRVSMSELTVFAGGHMHFSLPEEYIDNPRTHRKMAASCAVICDLFVAIPSLIMQTNVYDEVLRKRYYGQAGSFRTPEHGFEYRVLSNTVFSHPFWYYLYFGLAREAVNIAVNTKFKEKYERLIDFVVNNEKSIRVAIDEQDRVSARLLWDQYKHEIGDTLYPQVVDYLVGKRAYDPKYNFTDIMNYWGMLPDDDYYDDIDLGPHGVLNQVEYDMGDRFYSSDENSLETIDWKAYGKILEDMDVL